MRLRMIAVLALSSTALLGLTGSNQEQEYRPSRVSRIYYFFSPEAPDGASTARRAHDLAQTPSLEAGLLRPVLLLEDFRALSKASRHPGFLKTLKTLEKVGGGKLDLPLYDTEGLRLARAWRIRSLPAIVVVSNGHAHVYEGASADPTDHARCGR